MTFLFRADASLEIGTGHVMRCLALAQAVMDQGDQTIFLCAHLLPALKPRLEQERCEVRTIAVEAGSLQDAEATIAAARKCGAEWIIADGYRFGDAYWQRLREAGLHVLALDDEGRPVPVNLLLNQNLYASEKQYQPHSSDTRLLLGARYALLRREFAEVTDAMRFSDMPRRVLVTFGGVDAAGNTPKVLRALGAAGMKDLEVTVAGGAGPHLEEVRALTATLPFRVTLSPHEQHMAALIRASDIAIAAGGSSCYEFAAMGLPAMLVIAADNQRRVAASFDEAGVAQCLGWHEDVTEEKIASAFAKLMEDQPRRAAMGERGKQLVDAWGARRVYRAMTGLPLWLRPANVEDEKILWEWANDPGVRTSSLSPESIPWDTHTAWFQKKLRDPACRMFVGVNENEELVGQVRFDIEHDTAEVDVHTSQGHRGKGYGTALISAAVAMLFARTPVREVHALVRPQNAASAAAFAKAGFLEIGHEQRKGESLLRLVRQRV